MAFKPGQSGNPKGRAQGSQNKITRALKEAILIAAERAGFKLKPDVAATEGGLVGYLETVAIQEVGAFCSLLGKVFPTTLNDDDAKKVSAPLKIINEFVWPKDKDGNIIYPSWWNDEEMNREFSHRNQLKNPKESANLIEDELQEFGDLKTSG